nr:DUF4411 family protein [Methanobrevibacter arboriphilus]
MKKLFPYNENEKHKVVEWADKHEKMFVGPKDNKYGEESNFIRKKLPGWYKYHTNREISGDLELIIHAKAYNLVLVTLEGWNCDKSKQKSLKIPNVCRLLGAYCRNGKESTFEINPVTGPFQCIDFTELFRREQLYK